VERAIADTVVAEAVAEAVVGTKDDPAKRFEAEKDPIAEDTVQTEGNLAGRFASGLLVGAPWAGTAEVHMDAAVGKVSAMGLEAAGTV
jgi:hypothetical protein